MSLIRRLSIAALLTAACQPQSSKSKPDPLANKRVIKVTVNGPGVVSSTPTGVSCPGSCAISFDAASSITLVAQPTQPGAFLSWGGACAGTSASCTLTLQEDTVVNANFSKAFSLSVKVTGAGTGKITAEGTPLSCTKQGGACEIMAATALSINLTAKPDVGYLFHRWLGVEGCHRTSVCRVTLDQATTITASFVPAVFVSQRAIDGKSNSPNTTAAKNIWVATTDGNATPLTNLQTGGAHSVSPRWSPDGNKVIYISARNLDPAQDGVNNPGGSIRNNLWVHDVASKISTPLTTFKTQAEVLDLGLDWADDGRVAFVSNAASDLSDVASATSNVFVMSADLKRAGPLKFSSTNYHHSPRFSPDGQRVIYLSDEIPGTPPPSPPSVANLWLIAAAGGTPQRITNFPAGCDAIGPEWSPDGAQLVYASKRPLLQSSTAAGPSANVWITTVDGLLSFPVTRNDAADADANGPQWSNDGQRIVFSSRMPLDTGTPSPSLPFNLWFAETDGVRAPTPLTRFAPSAGAITLQNPSFTSDGKWLIYESTQPIPPGSTIFNVWLIDLERQLQSPLTTLTAPGADSFAAVNAN